MLPESWSHNGNSYPLAHLRPSHHSCTWTDKSGHTHFFEGRIRYSVHCISEAITTGLDCNAKHLLDHVGRPRRFDEERYHLSLLLPNLMESLFLKPTTSVSLTAKKNYFVFQTAKVGEIQAGTKYYAFFNPQYKFHDRADPKRHHIELYIESAYSRAKAPQTPHHKQRLMFGDLLTRLIK